MAQGVKTVKIKFAADGSQVKPGADEAAKSLDGFGSKVKGLAGDIAGSALKFAGIGLAIGGISEIFNNAFEQINIENKLKAKLGVGTQIAKDAATSVAEVYKQGIGDSFDEVADAVDAVASNLNGLTDTSAESLNRLTPIAIGLQKVYGVDVQEQLRAVSQLLRTGLVKDAQTGFDLIATAEQKFGAGAEDILDTFNEYSVQFKKIGIDGPQALGLISQLMKGGARNTDLAADALKEFAIRAIDGSASTIDAYKRLNLNVKETTNNMAKGGPVAQETFNKIVQALKNVGNEADKKQIAVELFGTQAEDLGDALYNIDATKAVSELGNFAGSAQSAADAVNKGPQQVISEFGRTLQDFATNVIGTYVIPAITAVANWIQNTLVPAFQATESWLEQHIYPAFLAVFGWLQRNVWPIMVDVADAVVYVWTALQAAWGQIQPYVEALWNGIVQFVTPLLDQFVSVVTDVWNKMKPSIDELRDFIKDHWDEIKLAFELALLTIGLVVGAIASVIGGIIIVFGTLVIAVVGAVKVIIDYLAGAAQFVNWLGQQWNNTMDLIKSAIQSAGNIIRDAWNNITSSLSDALQRGKDRWNDFVGVIQAIGNRIKGIFPGIWAGITDGLKFGLNGAIGIINHAIDALNAVTGVVHVPAIPHIPYLAKGGTARAGQSYVVGENGPELFEPGTTGRVVSNDSAFGGGDINPIVQVFIGDRELTDIVDTRVKINNREVKRSVRSGSTA